MSRIAKQLLPWFEQHGRKHLPWQQDVNAYRVWVSEIMLQQTQVATVIPYFERFMQSFPDVFALAAASQDDVLRHWAGLGYYARGRNLHKAAQALQQEHAGEFPDTVDGLVALPGIGRSTAGAILSLACGQPTAILDGNVKRVLARVFEVDGWPGATATARRLWALAEQQTPRRQTAQYNQAMMDLGSMVCTRSRPDCAHCPLRKMCQSQRHGHQALYPHGKPKKAKPQRHRWFLLHHCDDLLLLQKRPPTGIWGGLWSLPEIEQLAELEVWQQQQLRFTAAANWRHENLLKHAFTHFDLTISLAQIHLSRDAVQTLQPGVGEEGALRWVHRDELAHFGLPAPVEKILQRHQAGSLVENAG